MSTRQQDPRFTREIKSTPEYLEGLYSMCHAPDTLLKRRYNLNADPHDRIEQKLRCLKCLDRVARPPATSPTSPASPIDRTQKVCFFHIGKIRASKWTCCGEANNSKGCTWKHQHTIPPNNDPTLQEYWRFYETPEPKIYQAAEQVMRTDSKQKRQQKKQQWAEFVGHKNQHRKVVVLDCEMGVSGTKWPELIRFSVVDFFTAEVLIDSLVCPDVYLRSLSTPWSGVSWDMMWKAVNASSCFFGRDAAREGLWKFVGPGTIIIIHAGENDMNVFRCIHPRIIDTQELRGGQVGLRNLSSAMLGISIQNDGGHDSLEDTMATREVAFSFLKRHIQSNKMTTNITVPFAPAFAAPLVPAKPKSWASLVYTGGAAGSFNMTTARPVHAATIQSDEDDARPEMIDEQFDGRKIDFRVAPEP